MDIPYKSWVEEEFCKIDFKDKRLVKRFYAIIHQFVKKAQSNISSSFEQWSDIKACYRFFDNEKISSKTILKEHIESSVSRINSAQETILIAHDTTYIDYKTRSKTSDLDKLFRAKKGQDGSLGIILHNSLALTEEGVPLGIVNQQFVRRETINREKKGMLTKQYVHTVPIEKKESFRWIDAINKVKDLSIKSRQVHIADREGDIYELYRDSATQNVEFLIRARLNRSINKEKRREKPKDKLFEYFSSLPTKLNIKLKFQINDTTKYRTANLSITYDQFTLSPPPNRTINKDGDDLTNILLWGISIKEHQPPGNHEPLNWFLITNIPITNNEEAAEKVGWYAKRWNIEIFHKILKSGCSIEQAQLRSRDKLIKYITVKSIVAWKLFWLARNFKIRPQDDCSVIFNYREQEVLYMRFNNGKKPTEQISVKDAFIWIAKLGGYIGRKSDQPPGIISIWKGWTRFMAMVEDYKILNGV